MKKATLLSLLALFLLAAPSHAATTYVHAGSNLQTAINSAQPGDVLILDAGATFTGPITLPSKGGSSYITIQSSALSSLPGQSQRVSPADAANMPKLVSPGGGAALSTASGAGYYNFIGIEFAPSDSTISSIDTLITLGDGDSSAQATLTQIPHHLTFDRCYIHAYNTQSLKRGVGLNSRETSILNSYISGFKLLGQDSQAVAGWNGPGPFHIINNYIEGAGENVLFGGSDANNSNNQPSDIEVRRNLITKSLSWRPGDPSYAGSHWEVKNLLELKNAQRVTIEGNIFEYCWQDAQGGTAVVLTPRNQGGTNPWAGVNNVVMRNNIVRHVNNGIGTLSQDDEQASQVLHDVTITNNLLYDVDATVWGSAGTGGTFVSFNNAGAYNLTIQHNTAYTKDTGYLFETNTQISGLVIKDNIAHAHYLWNGEAGTSALNAAAPNGGWIAQRSVLVLEGYSGSASYWQQFYPATPDTYLTDTWASVGFVDAGNNNFRLSSTSPYVSSATDGRAIGCDLDTLAAATGGGFGDNFNDNVMDTSKWYKGVLNVPQSAYNPNVTVLEQNQRLEITPVANTSVWSHNGYVSAATYDFTGARASVQVPQVPTGGTAYAIFTVGIDSDNWYRIATSAGQIKFQDTVNGVKNSTTLTYNATQHKYWRIRHNSATDTIDFLTSSDGKVWTAQRSVARQLSVTALHIELDAGTFEAVSTPGKAIFDDLRFERNYWGEDFNDNIQDTLKWYQGVLNLDPSAYNPGVTVLERNSRLEITPIANTSVWSHNGYVSSATYDLTGARVSVQVPQVPTGGTAYAIFAVGIDSNNWYRITTTAGQMNFQDMVGGVKNTSSITYNAAQNQYWRIRHDTASDTIIFETSGDAVNWTARRTIARNLSITALQVELDAGTFEPVSAPGTAVFDNFRFDRP